MASAAFLLVINLTIGLGFAAAFLALGWRRTIPLAPWCATGFVAAAGTVCAEGVAAVIPSERFVSILSFSSLVFSIAFIASGLMRQYRPGASVKWLFGIVLAASILNGAFLFDLPRGSVLQSFGYQGAFALMMSIAAGIVLRVARKTAVDYALALVLVLTALHFLAKAAILSAIGVAPGVRDYITSPSAFYSQTAGSVLALMLGITLISKVASEALAEASRQARRDPLSGTLTRAAFAEEAARALAATPPGSSAAIVMCDLDHFKSVNDRFGHAAGDAVIEAFGAALITLAGPDGFCGRVGGEEFCVLMPDCDAALAKVRVEAARELVAATHLPVFPAGFFVTSSFGIALADRSESLEAAMHRADLALYAAKAAGRNAWRIAATARSVRPS